MSSTNKTTNYNLSQFVGTDVPSYLGDYNSDMSKIDKAIGDVANSQGSVEQSVVGLTTEVQGLSTQVDGMGTSVQQLQTSVAQIDSGYKQADTALSQRITANTNNIQTNTESIANINTSIGTEDISEIGDGTIKGAISNINSSLEELGNYIILLNSEANITDKTYTLEQSLSNFKTIAIAQNSIGDALCFDIKTLPVSVFKLYSEGIKIVYENDNIVGNVCYISDNNIKINLQTQGAHIVIYGIK